MHQGRIAILAYIDYYVLSRSTLEELAGQVDTDAMLRPGKSDLVFRSEKLASILSALEARYHVNIQCMTHVYDNRLLTVRFSQNETLEQSLKILSNVVGGMKYTIQGNVVFIEQE